MTPRAPWSGLDKGARGRAQWAHNRPVVAVPALHCLPIAAHAGSILPQWPPPHPHGRAVTSRRRPQAGWQHLAEQPNGHPPPPPPPLLPPSPDTTLFPVQPPHHWCPTRRARKNYQAGRAIVSTPGPVLVAGVETGDAGGRPASEGRARGESCRNKSKLFAQTPGERVNGRGDSPGVVSRRACVGHLAGR